MTESLTPARFAGLDLLASSVLVADADGAVRYANPAAENLLETSVKQLTRSNLRTLFDNGDELAGLCAEALAQRWSDRRQDLTLDRHGREPLHVHSIVTA
ncbi:MAG: PAS domain-containing protein, partial [Telluria sp.]